MVAKKNKNLKRKISQKKKLSTSKKNSKQLQLSKKTNKTKKSSINISLVLKNTISSLKETLSNFILILYSSLRNLIRAPFLFINVFTSAIIFILKKFIFSFFSFLKNLLTSMLKFKEAFFGVIFGILSGGIGAILAISYLELSSDENKKDLDIYEKQQQIISKMELIQNDIDNANKSGNENKAAINNIKLIQEKLLVSEEKHASLEKEINNLNASLKILEQETYSIDSDLSVLRKDLKSNSRLILSSSKTELSNRLYLAQSLLDRLESGVPYSPQLEALGKEGLHPALLRFAKGGAPTLKDLEARLSARAGEQLDADRTKRDTTWKENLKKEISKYVKIKPTNISEIKGVTGALLRAEQSLSRGNLVKAIDEISSVPVDQRRGPLDAWLAEAMARQSADIAARNILAKTTAALQLKN